MMVISTERIAKAAQNLFTPDDNLRNICTLLQTACKTFVQPGVSIQYYRAFIKVV